MIDKDQTVERLTRITEVLRENLADETNDDRMTLENTEWYLTRLLDQLTDTETVTGSPTLDLLVSFALMAPLGQNDQAEQEDPDKCTTCKGCTNRACIVGVLDPSHSCHCN